MEKGNMVSILEIQVFSKLIQPRHNIPVHSIGLVKNISIALDYLNYLHHKIIDDYLSSQNSSRQKAVAEVLVFAVSLAPTKFQPMFYTPYLPFFPKANASGLDETSSLPLKERHQE